MQAMCQTQRTTTTHQQNRIFYSYTELSPERMKQISDWIGTLTDDQKNMVAELENDSIQDDQNPGW